MRRTSAHLLATLLVLVAFALPAEAQRRGGSGESGDTPSVDLSDSALVATIPVRSIGPAVMSGRVADIAVASSPGVRGGSLGSVIYIAAATGGVWKSTSGGVTWTPILDDAGVGSMGAVAVSPSNSDIVWVGSGEPQNMRSSSYGDGVYKSVDGGETFRHMGLRTSQHVGRIVIHPENPDIVYVAAVGPLWASGGERGLFRTSNGGETWENVLEIDEHTGVTDLVMDPTDPDVLYAATLQRQRRAYSYIGGGTGSGIHKSTDGGDTWTELTHGLPTSDVGRIGLSISLSQPRTLYAVIEGSEQGVYRTDNGGDVWRKTSGTSSIPWYFGQIRVDPNDPEIVYHLGVRLQRSDDGGETFERAANSVHADQHAMWINPENSHHIILGNDGGLYQSYDRGETWDFAPNLPISQFYTVGLDMQEPFFGIYGGLQDNATWGGPSRTRTSLGIPNASWRRLAGGDGFYAAIDPTDHNIVYVESQNGNISRFDGHTGEGKPIKPQPEEGEPPYRFNWSAPIMISPFDHNTIYFAANHLFKSPDRGDSWQVLGEDLTQAFDRDSLPMFGSTPDDDAVSRHQGTAVFSNISTIDVSTLTPGLLVTGSDDGMVAVSRDEGVTWTKRTRFPGVPDTTYVSKVRWSRHAEAVLYVTFDGHRSNDFRPYVLRSDDYGESWDNIASNLPDFGNVRAFAEHPGNPNLLFVGTEIAPFVSMDGGTSWTRIRNGMPPAPVHDMKVHARDNALVIATHGRGFFLIDDLLPLEYLAEAKDSGVPFLFPVAPTLSFRPDGSRSSGTSADRNYRAANPPVGATISFLMPEAPSDGGATLEIVGRSGDVVRKLEVPKEGGFHHVLWDLRVDAPYSGPPARAGGSGGRGGGGGGFGGRGGGPQGGAPAVPGMYTARLTIPGGQDPVVLERPLRVMKDRNVVLSDADLEELFDIRMRQMRLNARNQMALRAVDAIQEQVTQATDAMDQIDAPEPLGDQADALRDDIADVILILRGREGRGGGGGGGGDSDDQEPRSVRQRLQTASGVHRATAMPTRQEMDALRSVFVDLEREVTRINEILTERMPAFFSALDDVGVPWTPGRPIPAVGG